VSDLSFAQNNGNVRKSEEPMQWDKHELSEGRGRLKRDGAKPSLPVKRADAADLREILNHVFDSVLPQSKRFARQGNCI
jgi:hypothetical protein